MCTSICDDYMSCLLGLEKEKKRLRAAYKYLSRHKFPLGLGAWLSAHQSKLLFEVSFP